ncbi:hypothetical protein FNV43_RR14106 [Rhamnella rubrinervis]|uniref:Uncharacterized protein n=1 Tax=Rhamnella rubrinervis TaxID=2594499 RepID=A0A8K0H2E6_9ROSA|nr:hypothetical protein FNV43_RR14106 [Rhamnella rubrinervis]
MSICNIKNLEGQREGSQVGTQNYSWNYLQMGFFTVDCPQTWKAVTAEKLSVSCKTTLIFREIGLFSQRLQSFSQQQLSMSASQIQRHFCGTVHLFNITICHDILVYDHVESSGASDVEEDLHALWKFARKLQVPVLFFISLLAHLDDPITLLAFKVGIFELDLLVQVSTFFMKYEPKLDYILYIGEFWKL